MASVFTRLLLATEHSEFDTGALALALALARRGALPLAGVLPIVSNPEFEMVAPQLAAKADAEASIKRQDLEARARQEGVALDLHARHGPEAYVEIVEEARERSADLIVIRRRGKRGLLANLLIGEMVSKVVAHAPCSVLIAPRGAQLWAKGVRVGIDPQNPESPLVARAAALAEEFGLPLSLVCVASTESARPQAEQALSVALARARAWHRATVGEVRVGRPHEGLIATSPAHPADLIVVGRHSHTTLGHAWIGGTAQKVIGLADCPVLVHVNNPEAKADAT